MLKIKDNVDLKELKKYGFGKSFVSGDYRYLLDDISTLWISSCTKELSIVIDSGCNREILTLSKIYDLIQAGLVEKV